MASTAVSPYQGFDPAALPDVFRQGVTPAADLASGMSGGFAVVSLRQSMWRIKYQGEEIVIRNADGEPARKLSAIIVAANPNLSKTYYAGKYMPGSDAAPDCYSNDGLTPDPSVAEPVSHVCAACPMNQIGSMTTDNGKKAKACADGRRLAVVPATDIENADYGGPMLLRVPPASLAPLAEFQRELNRQAPGVPYYAVAVEIGFDEKVDYPRLTFTAKRIVSNPEKAALIVAMREDPVVESILFGGVTAGAAEAPARPVAAAKPATKPAAKPAAKAVAAKPAPEPEPEAEETQEETQEEQEEAPAPVAAKKAAAPKTKTTATAPVVEPGDDVNDLLADL